MQTDDELLKNHNAVLYEIEIPKTENTTLKKRLGISCEA